MKTQYMLVLVVALIASTVVTTAGEYYQGCGTLIKDIEGCTVYYNEACYHSPICEGGLFLLENLENYEYDERGFEPWLYVTGYRTTVMTFCSTNVMLEDNTITAIHRGDFNGDHTTDFADFAILASFWLQTCRPGPGRGRWCDGVDFHRDGIVDIYDLAELAENWLSDECHFCPPPF